MSARSLAWPRALALIIALGAVGCAERNESKPSPAASACSCPPVSAPVVDPTLLAFLSKARVAHHEADLAEQANDRSKAIQALSQLVTGPMPGGAAPSPEVAEVVADTRARLADLRSATGDFDAALRDVDEGLALAREETHFRGHLFEVRGVVEERRSKALTEKGDAPGAEAARKEALAAFEKAIEIQDSVIAKALEPAGGGAPSERGDAGPR